MDKNAKMMYNREDGGDLMHVHRFDKTDFPPHSYLQINSCGFQNFFSDYKVVRPDGRKDYHILFLNGGVCEAIHNQKVYTLKKGNVLVYAPGEPQEYTFRNESMSLWIHVTGTAIDEIFNSADIKSGMYDLSFSKTVFETCSKLIQRFNCAEQKKFANASFLELLSYLSDAIHFPEASERLDCIASALTYIQMNYNKHITVDELSEKTGYSKSRFSHIFSEAMGTTPMRYQNSIRLSNACEMLRQTDLSITEISHYCGFDDSLYFSRKFRKKYMMSPSEYRLSMLN